MAPMGEIPGWLLLLALAGGFCLFVASFKYSSVAGKLLDKLESFRTGNDNLSDESCQYICNTQVAGFEKLATEQPDPTLLKILQAIRYHCAERQKASQRLNAELKEISFFNFVRCSLSIPAVGNQASPKTKTEFRALVRQAEDDLATVIDAGQSIRFLNDVSKRRLFANLKATSSEHAR